jgi:integrase
MANIKIEIHNRSIASRKKGLNNWNIPQEEKNSLLKFLDELALGKVNKGIKISESRQSKYLDILRPPLTFFKKSVKELVLKDVEKFEKAMSSGILESNKGEAYSRSTQVDIRRALRIYLRWKLGKDKADKLTDWFDTRSVMKTPEYLKEKEVEKLYKACKSAEERYLIAVLFDSGARAEEFHNIRYEDIQLPKEKENFIKLTLKEEYSKTKGRTISLYWKYSLEAVSEFLKQREREGIQSNEQVYIKAYDNSRKFLQRLGKKILGKSIHYHLFRHSSATYYASKLNRQQICVRYGWAFSSRMPDVYISRAGMENAEIDEKIAQTELGDLKAKLERQEQENKIMKERQEQLEKRFERREKLDPLIDEVVKKKAKKK